MVKLSKIMEAEFFQQISIEVPKERIFLRLGYRKGKTVFSQNSSIRFESYLREALSCINLKGAALVVPIASLSKKEVCLKGGFVIKSSSFAEFLYGCGEILFLGATAGSDIIKLISSGKDRQDLEGAVIADAAASQMADAALDWIVAYKARQLLRQNKVLTEKRFSPGYADFNLSYQEMIYRILNLKKIGITLKKTYMLNPEKSVTAACGIK